MSSCLLLLFIHVLKNTIFFLHLNSTSNHKWNISLVFFYFWNIIFIYFRGWFFGTSLFHRSTTIWFAICLNIRTLEFLFSFKRILWIKYIIGELLKLSMSWEFLTLLFFFFNGRWCYNYLYFGFISWLNR